MDLSLITSLYRAEPYLAAYTGHVRRVAAQVRSAGLSLELVIVANDATDRERALLAPLVAAGEAGELAVQVLHVPRETIYASWNRGVRAARGRYIGVWNADDVREAGALVEGYRRISEGCALVYFPYVILRERRWWGLFTTRRMIDVPARPFDRAAFERTSRTGTFYLFDRALYDRVGPFDERFHIAGDFEWLVRAGRLVDFCAGESLGGVFTQGARNLSGTGDPRQNVEDNIVHLRGGNWDALKPADPRLMRAYWDEWGRQDADPPPEIADRLWGPGADECWRRWQRRQRLKPWDEALRAGPRFVIDRTGLRPLLARLGVVKSASRSQE